MGKTQVKVVYSFACWGCAWQRKETKAEMGWNWWRRSYELMHACVCVRWVRLCMEWGVRVSEKKEKRLRRSCHFSELVILCVFLSRLFAKSPTLGRGPGSDGCPRNLCTLLPPSFLSLISHFYPITHSISLLLSSAISSQLTLWNDISC